MENLNTFFDFCLIIAASILVIMAIRIGAPYTTKIKTRKVNLVAQQKLHYHNK